MKKLILLLMIVNLNSQAQKKTKKIMMTDKNFERFEIIEFLNNGRKIPLDNQGNFEYDYVKKTNDFIIYMIGRKNRFYTSRQYSLHNCYVIAKRYNGDGSIKEKGICFNGPGETKLGIWYEFDNSGKLINEVKYDKDYHFTFRKLLAFCQSRKIIIENGDIPRIEGGFHTTIMKEILNNKNVWKIQYQDGIKPAYKNFSNGEMRGERPIYEELILDGQTGKEISNKTIGLDH